MRSAFMPAALIEATSWSSQVQSNDDALVGWTQDQLASTRTQRRPILDMLARSAACWLAVSPQSRDADTKGHTHSGETRIVVPKP